jgi:hypothetical protein
MRKTTTVAMKVASAARSGQRQALRRERRDLEERAVSGSFDGSREWTAG